MTIDPKSWLAMEQAMEEDSHVLSKLEVIDPPQLLMISSHAAKGTSSVATPSLGTCGRCDCTGPRFDGAPEIFVTLLGPCV
jgi:hypothetical protein